MATAGPAGAAIDDYDDGREGRHGRILREMLVVDGDSKNKRIIFRHLARSCAANLLHGFDARCLANLSYAHAVVGCDPKLDDDDGGILRKLDECRIKMDDKSRQVMGGGPQGTL